MATFSKIKHISLAKLNNAEHLSFLMLTVDLIGNNVEEAAQLGISAKEYDAFTACIDELGDIVKQSLISNETAQMSAIDLRRTQLAIHIFSTLRTARYAPLETHRSAAIRLYNIVKPSTGLRRKPQQQKTSIIFALLMDLNAPEHAEDVSLLALTETLTQLETDNKRYLELTKQRSATQMALHLGDARPVRRRADTLYENMMTMVFVTSISKPSDRTATFIAKQNKLIDDTKASFKLRKALKRNGKKPTDDPEQA